MIVFLLTLACKKSTPVTQPVVEPPPPAVVPKKAPEQIPEVVMSMAKNFERVFFDVDSSQLNSEAKQALSANVEIMKGNGNLRIEIQGHADERGTTDYNLALGQRRAQSVLDFMQTQGVPSSRIRIISYGEERPLQQGSNERTWSKNRRCEFAILWSEHENIQGTTD